MCVAEMETGTERKKKEIVHPKFLRFQEREIEEEEEKGGGWEKSCLPKEKVGRKRS